MEMDQFHVLSREANVNLRTFDKVAMADDQ
jgi:hypothetical protein